jgi:spermidine/putrescine transport system substrate-binding protein
VGLLRPLNHSYIPNTKNLWSSFTDPGKPFWDVGQQYTVPYTVYTTGIGYRFDPDSPNAHIALDLSDQQDAIPSMKNPYDVLWDTKWKPYVHILDDYREALAMAMIRRGETDVNTSDPKVIAQARDDLIKGVNSMDWKLDVNDYTDMPEGQSYIHQGWSGDFVSVQYFYPGWSPTNVISYWYPENGKGSVGGDHFAVLASGRNPVLAHQFLNYMLDFNNAMDNFQWNGYLPPQNRVQDPNQLLKDSPNPLKPYNIIPPEMPRAVVTQKDLDNGFEQLEIAPDIDELYKSAWEAVKTA